MGASWEHCAKYNGAVRSALGCTVGHMGTELDTWKFQAHGHCASPCSDYSLLVLMFFLLIGQLPFPSDCLYADPERKAYDVLGLYYGFGRTFFSPASAKVFSRFEALQKAVRNYTIEATPDDRSSVLQQGGMLVFNGKQLLYARKDEGTGDHAPLDDIFNICCKVPVA
ncbi:hypothetical protein RJ639_017202 [Escallonia herrerae]|uniref:Uncharacterized protein n=1 Tax=Escallonia herrerae TaxID=1293975 RepID=A0AA88VGP7_9ASTE|nr:hypothetical protein RJ639_017202 [Escallonia herrerae]